MGVRRDSLSVTPGTQDILTILQNAERLFWSDLALIAKRGNVFHIRDAAVSLAIIRAFQDTLGRARPEGPILASSLLGESDISNCEPSAHAEAKINPPRSPCVERFLK